MAAVDDQPSSSKGIVIGRFIGREMQKEIKMHLHIEY